MGIGIFKKIKNAFHSIGNKVKDFASKAINALPQVAKVGHDVLNKVKPITQFIPGVGQVVDTFDKGFDFASKAGTIGKSLMNDFK